MQIPSGAVLELVYYRYLYFQEDGRVLYALTATPPHEMIPRLLRMCLTPSEKDRAAVWGTYRVKKTTVTVKAQQEWQYVQLVLSIDTTDRLHGRYGLLAMEEHYTSKTGNFDKDDWRSDRIRYDVPDEPFRFIKDKRL
jgi:F-box protein 9